MLSDNLRISFKGGNGLLIEHYQQGIGGLNVQAAQDILSNHIEAEFPSMRGAVFLSGPDGYYFGEVETLHVLYLTPNI